MPVSSGQEEHILKCGPETSPSRLDVYSAMLAPSVAGPIAPVGPTSFEFVVPDDAPLTLAPSVGTVMPGKVSIQSVFRCKHIMWTAQFNSGTCIHFPKCMFCQPVYIIR